MPEFAVDFSKVEADEYTVLPVGEYDMVIKSVQMGQSDKEDSSPYMRFEFAVAEEGDFKGRVVYLYSSFSPKSLGRTKNFLESIGVDVSGEVKIEVDPTTKIVTVPDMTGEAVRVKVKNEVFEDEPRAKVSRAKGTHETELDRKKPGAASNGKPAATGAKYK